MDDNLTGVTVHPNGRYGAYYKGIPLQTHENLAEAWRDILDNGNHMFLRNKDRTERWIKCRRDKPEPKIGQIIRGFLITSKRFVRDGMLGSHHCEFYGISMNGMQGEHWFHLKTLQDFMD